MLIELHCHTTEHSPCSRTAAVDLVVAVHNRGGNGIVITDHHYLWSPGQLAALKRDSRLPEDFIIMSGQEVSTTDFGDVLVYGAGRSFSSGISLSALRQACPTAALVWAHPYRYARLPTVVELMNSAFDAVEIVNPHHSAEENQRAVIDWKRWGYRATSGSDIHRADFVDFYPVQFDCAITGIDDLAACIKEGRFSPRAGAYFM